MEAKKVEVISHPYHWEFEDQYTEKDGIEIRTWTLNRDSEPCLIRFPDFPVFCHVELPMFVQRRFFHWTRGRAEIIYTYLQKVLNEDAPNSFIFKEAEKIYHYRQDRKYPMMLLMFNSVKAMKHCKAVLSRVQNIGDMGALMLQVWEDEISPIRKLLTAKNLLYSQWFKILAVEASDSDRISKLDSEYIAYWRDIVPIEQDVTKSWTTHPGFLAYDIETYSDNPRAFPNKYNENNPAYMLSAIYQKTGKRDTRKRFLIIMGDCNDIDGVEVIRVRDEKELCKVFCDIIGQCRPQIITGYNIFGYDYPYLNARLSRYLDGEWSESASLLIGKRPHFINSKAWSSSGYGHNSTEHINFPGAISVDLLPVIRRDYKFPKYDLNTVGNHFLNRGKHEVSPQDMFRIYDQLTVSTLLYQECIKEWVSDGGRGDLSSPVLGSGSIDGGREEVPIYHDNVPTEIIEECRRYYEEGKKQMTRVSLYCVEDSELVIDIIEKITLWIAMIEMSNIAAVTMFDLFTRGQQIRGLSQIYNLAASLGVVVDHRKSERVEFSGGFVYEPTPGLFDQTICLDFKSLYPNLMRAFNICYSTLVPTELDKIVPDSNCNVIEWDDEVEVNKKKNGDDDDEDIPDLVETEIKRTHYKFRFIKKEIKEGILPRLVERLIEGRNSVRAQQKGAADPVIWNVLEQRQLALKITANSMYGMLGVQPRLDDPDKKEGLLSLIEGAMSITAAGREKIQWSNDYIQKTYNGLVVYNDTDSTMVKLPFITNNREALEWGFRLEKEISALFPDPLYLEFEKAGRILCIRKKKYAFWLIDKNKKIRSPGNQQEWIDNPNYGELRNPDTDKDAIMTKGIILARRDNCMWQREFYRRVLTNILTRQPMQSTLDIILSEVLKMWRGEISWEKLSIIKGLNSNYKSDTYSMKIFSDELRRIGKPASAGERLEYVIVEPKDAPKKKDGSILLGYKMRLVDTYSERLDTDMEEPIDRSYYIENVVKNCIEQLWMIGYKNELEQIEIDGLYNDRLKVLHKLIELGHNDIVQQTYLDCNGDVKMTIDVLGKTTGLKTKTQNAVREFITGRKTFPMRPNKNIIQRFLMMARQGMLHDFVRAVSSGVADIFYGKEGFEIEIDTEEPMMRTGQYVKSAEKI